MDYMQNLKDGTTTLIQAVGILQGTRWDATQEEAKAYLMSMDMDFASASSLVADMETDFFTQTVENLLRGEYAKTGYKSIAVWVRKFGLSAELTTTGDFWEITLCEEEILAAEGHRSIGRGGCIGIIAVVIAVAVFLGVWIFTGNIWAAIYLFEVILEFILEFADF